MVAVILYYPSHRAELILSLSEKFRRIIFTIGASSSLKKPIRLFQISLV